MVQQKWLKNLPEEEQIRLLKERHERDNEKARVAAQRDKFKVLARRHRVTESELLAIITGAAGKCKICRCDLEGKPHIDHCHNTMKIRGVLCASCNHGIARFQDDPALLRAAADYLDAYSRSFG